MCRIVLFEELPVDAAFPLHTWSVPRIVGALFLADNVFIPVCQEGETVPRGIFFLIPGFRRTQTSCIRYYRERTFLQNKLIFGIFCKMAFTNLRGRILVVVNAVEGRYVQPCHVYYDFFSSTTILAWLLVLT